jgi:AraC-like DNA-binding protein
VKPVSYTPPADYAHDVEVYPVAELRRRARRFDALGIERIDFHCLIHVVSGRYRHMVDFETFDCGPGSVLVIQPAQVHRFGTLERWAGWLLVFRAEAVPSRLTSAGRDELEAFRQLADMPTHLKVPESARAAVAATFEQLAADARVSGPAWLVNALLRRQIEALLVRLQLSTPARGTESLVDTVALQRFRRYKATVEREFRRWHSVARYASLLGCSEKSLSRATYAVAQMSAKTLLVDRLVLEAKRMLAHSSSPVGAIALDLGFDEATNFVKFFRRETGMTPGAFRERHARHPTRP